MIVNLLETADYSGIGIRNLPKPAELVKRVRAADIPVQRFLRWIHPYVIFRFLEGTEIRL